MDELKLRIIDDKGQTRTLIQNKEGIVLRNDIVFHNESKNAVLKVDFDIDMDTSGLNKRAISVPAGGEETVKFKAGTKKGTKVKYTAKIGSANSEDPIIIFER